MAKLGSNATIRKGFHILLALTLVACALCPYVEVAIHWNQSIFDTGYDGESTVAVIALLLILAFAIANLLIYFVANADDQEGLVDAPKPSRPRPDFVPTVPAISPPLQIRT